MKRFAFFDVDETIIYEKSMFSILDEINKIFPSVQPRIIQKRLQELRNKGVDRSIVNREFYKELKGLPRRGVINISNNYINKRIRDNNKFLIPEVINMMEFYREKGYSPAFISGSAVDFILPLAKHLHVKYCLATKLVIDKDGIYTGEIEGQSMIGEGKRNSIQDFLRQHAVEASVCAGFGDHTSDLAFLEFTGEPHVVATSDEKLVFIAQQRGWPVIYP